MATEDKKTKKGAAQDWKCTSTCEHNSRKGQTTPLASARSHIPCYSMASSPATHRKASSEGKELNQDKIS